MGNLEKPITTQEELDALIGERLTRDRETRAKRYEGWISPEDAAKAMKELQTKHDALAAQVEEHTKTAAAAAQQIADLQAQNRRYEIASVKRRVANELGLDWNLADRIAGETEDEIRADAESLKGLIGQNTHQTPPPLLNYEQGDGKKQAAWNSMLSNLRGE